MTEENRKEAVNYIMDSEDFHCCPATALGLMRKISSTDGFADLIIYDKELQKMVADGKLINAGIMPQTKFVVSKPIRDNWITQFLYTFDEYIDVEDDKRDDDTVIDELVKLLFERESTLKHKINELKELFGDRILLRKESLTRYEVLQLIKCFPFYIGDIQPYDREIVADILYQHWSESYVPDVIPGNDIDGFVEYFEKFLDDKTHTHTYSAQSRADLIKMIRENKEPTI